MAAASDISKVELAIEYTFKQKDLVTLSLTAAGGRGGAEESRCQ